MIAAGEIQQIRRRLREAEEGSTQDKVSARANYAQDVRALLDAMEEQGIALAISRIDELETEVQRFRQAGEKRDRQFSEAELVPMPRKQPRLEFSMPQHDGKLAAAGKDD
jgi:hypothetical protein